MGNMHCSAGGKGREGQMECTYENEGVWIRDSCRCVVHMCMGVT